MSTVYIQKEDVQHVNLVNGTGAALAQGELTVIGGRVLIADEAIASTARGSFSLAKDMVIQIDNFVATEDTFGTANAVAYWNPADGKFSDTSTATYYPIGIVHTVKNSNGVVLVLCSEYTTAVPA